MSDGTIRTTGNYCRFGCNFDAVFPGEGGAAKGRSLKSLLRSKGHPVNLRKSFPKGLNLLKAFASEERLTRPLLRNGRANSICSGATSRSSCFHLGSRNRKAKRVLSRLPF